MKTILCKSAPISQSNLWKKLGCHTILHALQQLKWSLPARLIKDVISYTWLDIFPTSFTNLYCIRTFTNCAFPPSPPPITTLPRMDTRVTCYHFQGHHNKCALASLILLLQKYTVPMPGSLRYLSQENESSKMLLSNAFYELCSALQWLALLRILYLDYGYFSSGLLWNTIETRSDCLQKGAAHFKPF